MAFIFKRLSLASDSFSGTTVGCTVLDPTAAIIRRSTISDAYGDAATGLMEKILP